MRRTHLLLALASVLVIVGGYTLQQAEAAHSDHGCHNCHVPHNAGDPLDPLGDTAYGVPLWSNVQLEDAPLPTYTLYSSLTLDATDLSQPDGPSKLCLGCHDGSYGPWMDADRVFTADELANSHPVSFTYDTALATADGHLKDPATTDSGLGGTIAQDLLDIKGKLQCTGCHDVHTSGIGENLLRYDWDPLNHTDNIMCRVCHEK
jgi:hypothetical protein